MKTIYNHSQTTISFKYCDNDPSRIIFEPLNSKDDLDKETRKSGIKVHYCFMAMLRNFLSCLGVAYGTTVLKTNSGMIYLNNGSLQRFFKRHEKDVSGLSQLNTFNKIIKIVQHFILKKRADITGSLIPGEQEGSENLDRESSLFSKITDLASTQQALGCDRLKKRIDILNEWTQQIRDFVSNHQELGECFYKTFAQKGENVIATTVPILEGDMEDPEHLAYVLNRQLDKCKTQFGELIRFIVSNEELWNGFVAHLQKDENNTMLKLFDSIFTLLRMNIDKKSYEQVSTLLANEMEQLKSRKTYEIDLIRIVLIKLTSTFFELEFFMDELLNSVEK